MNMICLFWKVSMRMHRALMLLFVMGWLCWHTTIRCGGKNLENICRRRKGSEGRWKGNVQWGWRGGAQEGVVAQQAWALLRSGKIAAACSYPVIQDLMKGHLLGPIWVLSSLLSMLHAASIPSIRIASTSWWGTNRADRLTFTTSQGRSYIRGLERCS